MESLEGWEKESKHMFWTLALKSKRSSTKECDPPYAVLRIKAPPYAVLRIKAPPALESVVIYGCKPQHATVIG
jgi:hypothetical protein